MPRPGMGAPPPVRSNSAAMALRTAMVRTTWITTVDGTMNSVTPVVNAGEIQAVLLALISGSAIRTKDRASILPRRSRISVVEGRDRAPGGLRPARDRVCRMRGNVRGDAS